MIAAIAWLLSLEPRLYNLLIDENLQPDFTNSEKVEKIILSAQDKIRCLSCLVILAKLLHPKCSPDISLTCHVLPNTIECQHTCRNFSCFYSL